MARPTLIFLRWVVKTRCWLEAGHLAWVALALCPAAILIPHYLVKTAHHPPAGTYIAILGGLAAAVTLRNNPPLKEKAAWIFLISLLMVAEIRNLYVADGEQAETFSTILGGLQETKLGLDKTVTALGNASTSLQAISGQITDASTNSQKQFNATITRFGSLADQQQDALGEINGGESFPYIQFTNLQAFLLEKGHHPISQVTVQVLDTTATAEMNLSTGSPIPWIYEHTFPGPTRYNAQLTPVFTLNPPIHDTENLFVVMKALNGDFWEQILLHRSNGTWHEAILVTAFYRATIGEHVTKRAGVVLEEIDPNIPSEILRSNGWDAKKWPHPIIPKP